MKTWPEIRPEKNIENAENLPKKSRHKVKTKKTEARISAGVENPKNCIPKNAEVTAPQNQDAKATIKNPLILESLNKIPLLSKCHGLVGCAGGFGSGGWLGGCAGWLGAAGACGTLLAAGASTFQ